MLDDPLDNPIFEFLLRDAEQPVKTRKAPNNPLIIEKEQVTMTQHTSTPWKVGERHPCRIMMKPTTTGHLVASTCELQDEGTETEQQRVDAAHIVKAVNSHEALIRALEYCAYAPGEFAPANQAQYLVARAALATVNQGRS